MIKNIDNSIIVIESKDGNLVLRNDLNKEKLEYDFNIELESDEDNIGDIVVGFNSKHLKSILNLFDDKDKVEIAFESNIKPFTIKNDNKIALLLPIRGIE
jgi:DNA polymerase III sliding clamp (beta) subunit (PCNA family)